MDETLALESLGALSHETRLAAFRLLVKAGPEGLPAGIIAERLKVLPNTLSSHLGLLSRAGLITARRQGRVIRYAADYAGMGDLMAFLIRDCCGGQPEICGPLVTLAEECTTCVPVSGRG